MLNKELSEFVIFDQTKQVVRADQEMRVKAILNRDHDEFLRLKQYAIDNMNYLVGRRVPMEVYKITDLPEHNCIIIDDLILMSYTEAAEIIEAMKERDEHANERRSKSSTQSTATSTATNNKSGNGTNLLNDEGAQQIT